MTWLEGAERGSVARCSECEAAVDNKSLTVGCFRMLHNTEDHVMVITRPLLRDVAQRRSVTVDHIIVSLEVMK
ncbi:hypothetical protein J6590_099691 [Homalodisca vitripennis]|nr:hypothetical protein J6590_099691 [Homalodisca vitripennis]